MSLTADRVHRIRTEGRTDRYWERLYRVSAKTIGAARRGDTWCDHPTPPDNKPRVKLGNWGADNGPAR